MIKEQKEHGYYIPCNGTLKEIPHELLYQGEEIKSRKVYVLKKHMNTGEKVVKVLATNNISEVKDIAKSSLLVDHKANFRKITICENIGIRVQGKTVFMDKISLIYE